MRGVDGSFTHLIVETGMAWGLFPPTAKLVMDRGGAVAQCFLSKASHVTLRARGGGGEATRRTFRCLYTNNSVLRMYLASTVSSPIGTDGNIIAVDSLSSGEVIINVHDFNWVPSEDSTKYCQ